MVTITVARKPCSEKTVADNVLRWGTGGLNIDASRIAAPGEEIFTNAMSQEQGHREGKVYGKYNGREANQSAGQKLGRFPSNVLLEHQPECRRTESEEGPTWSCALGCPVREMDEQSGLRPGTRIEKPCNTNDLHTDGWGSFQGNRGPRGYDDTGGAARFFKQVGSGATQES